MKNYNKGKQRKFPRDAKRIKSSEDTTRSSSFKGRDTAGIPEENNWKFYAASEQIAKDIASLPFNYLGGTPFEISATGSTTSTNTPYTRTDALPAIMCLDYVNSIGVTNARTQGVNMAAVQLYTKIRQTNSGAKNYEAADVMMYVLALREIYSEYFECKKIIGTAGLYNYYNHNLPDIILGAMRINARDLRNNLAQYRGSLNLLARKINSFAVPKYFKMFDRAAYINSFLFTDSDSIRGQFYNFNKVGTYTWSGTTSESGTELVFAQRPNSAGSSSVATFQERLDTLSDMIDALFLDEDAITMSGDILKAFGDSDLYTVAETSEDYVVGYVHDEDILGQIENSHAMLPTGSRNQVETWNFNITQSNQIIKFQPNLIDPNSSVISGNPNPRVMTKLAFNSHKKDPQYTDVLEWSRLITMCQLSEATNTGSKLTVICSGLEIVLGYTITRATNSSLGYITNFFGNAITRSETNDAATMANISNFDWHPILYPYYNNGNLFIFGDLKVPTTIDTATMTKINDAAVYGALYGSGLYNDNN